MSSTPDLQIHLFGDLRILHRGETIGAGLAPRLQSLLAYLLLHHHSPQSRKRLAFLLWPDSSDAQAQTNLRKALTHLRHSHPLLDRALYADQQTIHWRPPFPFQVDVTEFETKIEQATHSPNPPGLDALAAAVDLYTAPLFPACYDEWIGGERERLHQLCLAALAPLLAEYENRREFALALGYAQNALRLDPLQESAQMAAMRLHALLGDRDAALALYRRYVALLQKEMDAPPGKEIQAAFARLLQGERPVAAAEALHAPPRLVGRQAEWQMLLRAWRESAGGQSSFVLLRGEAGIGKSRLAQELLEWAAAQGYSTAYTRAWPGEERMAYGPVPGWLRANPIRAVRHRVDPVWLSEAARLVPEILSEDAAVSPPEATGGSGQRRLWDGLARCLLSAPQPLLLVIDDLHWCDSATLEWLAHLLRLDEKARLLVLGTARPEETGKDHPLHSLLHQLRPGGSAWEIDIPALDGEAVATLAEQMRAQPLSPASRQALYRTTAGNPLYVVETIRAEDWMADKTTQSPIPNPRSPIPSLPPKIQAVIQSRLSHLSPSARELAQLAAVVGRAFSLDDLATFSGQAEMAVGQALEELWERRIIRQQTSHSYDFSHDRIRDVALGEINPVRRGLLHRRIAAGLQARYGDEVDPVVDALAWHCEQAGLIEQAVTFYQRAGILADSRFAYAQAGQHSRHALDLLATLPPSRATRSTELELLLVLAEALRKIAGFGSDEVFAVFSRATALCAAVGNPAQLYEIKHGFFGYYMNRSQLTLAHSFAVQSLEIAEQFGSRVPLPWRRVDFSWVYLGVGDFAGLLEQVEDIFLMSDAERQDPEAILRWVSGHALSAQSLWLLGYPEQARQHFQQAARFVSSYPGAMGQCVMLDTLATVASFWGDVEGIRAYADELERLTLENSIPLYRGIAEVYNGFVLVCQDRTESGIAHLMQGIAQVRQVGTTITVPYFQTLLVEAYELADQPIEALQELDESIALAESGGEVWWLAEQYRLRGELLAASGQTAEAAEWMQRGLEFARSLNARSLELRAAHSLARLWQGTDRAAEGLALLAAVYGWFSEGFDTPDLVAARQFLSNQNS